MRIVSTIGSSTFSHSAPIRACRMGRAAIIGVEEVIELHEINWLFRIQHQNQMFRPLELIFSWPLSWNKLNQSQMLISVHSPLCMEKWYFVIHLMDVPSTNNRFLPPTKGGIGPIPNSNGGLKWQGFSQWAEGDLQIYVLVCS